LRTESIGGTNYRIVTIPWHAGGSIEIARSLGETEDTLSSLGLELAAFSLLGALAAGLLGWFFARRMVRPVERLRDAAEQIARTQDLDTPVPVSGAGEIRSLAGSLTTMVDALGASRRQQQQLISDASHELRTPLTSLRTNAELLGRPAGLDDDQRRRVVEGIQYEVEELTNLVSEVVELATDRSSDDEVPITVMLADVAAPVIERARRRTGREITIDQADGDRVVARPHMIERAMSNLIDNAAKYSPADTPIVVTIDGRGFEVRDHGGGIAAEDLPHIFERFYRATAARTAAGSGLGLAIVQQIVDRHGGRTWARNAPDGGAVVGFELPAAANNSSPA
jgi:two-component system sensor histidine kinase MprB